MVALGSTLSVTPAADIPMAAARAGAPYVIVNRGSTDHDGSPMVSLRVDGDVSVVFPSAVDIALGNRDVRPGRPDGGDRYPRGTEASS